MAGTNGDPPLHVQLHVHVYDCRIPYQHISGSGNSQTNCTYAWVYPEIHNSRVVFLSNLMKDQVKASNVLCTVHWPHQSVMDKSRVVQRHSTTLQVNPCTCSVNVYIHEHKYFCNTSVIRISLYHPHYYDHISLGCNGYLQTWLHHNLSLRATGLWLHHWCCLPCLHQPAEPHNRS